MTATITHFTHKFNPSGPVGYFITFRTYGTWLHGNDKGSIDKSHNIPGTPIVSPDADLVNSKSFRQKYPSVTLTFSQRKSIGSIINGVSAYNKWKLHALSVRTEHIHVVISALKTPEEVMDSLKSWCTRRMREQGLWMYDYSPWSFHGSTRYLWNDKELRRVCNYVLNCQDNKHHMLNPDRQGGPPIPVCDRSAPRRSIAEPSPAEPRPLGMVSDSGMPRPLGRASGISDNAAPRPSGRAS